MTEVARTFDWRPKWDPRSDLFTVAQLDCFSSGSERDNIIRRKGVWLNQFQEGACTGFGTGHVLACTPNSVPGVTNTLAKSLYYEARRQDEWPGEDYEGSSVNGVMKAARLMQRISEWRWCKTLAEVRHALSYHGPLVIGINWYEGMLKPDVSNFVRVTGDVVGGHAIALVGYKTIDGVPRYRLENSWGQSWGDNGGCWITQAGLKRLLGEQGEFACPKKIVL